VLIFFQTLASNFSSLMPWNPSLFIGSRRGTLCLIWCQILALNSTWKNPNRRFKMDIIGCQIYYSKGLVGLVILGWCHSHHGVNRLERTTLGCSQMSGHHLHISFVQFDGEMKHWTPWKRGHSSSFSVKSWRRRWIVNPKTASFW
jgi:hypothetical protein